MLNVILEFETSTFLFFVTVCFVAGVIKGIIGFGMPMIILGASAAISLPSLGLAVLILPTLVTNIYQVSMFRRSDLVVCIKEFKFFLLFCLLGLFIGIKLFVLADLSYLVAGIGFVVLVVSFAQLIKLKGPKVNNSVRRSSIFGMITGLLGGGTGIWGPTTVLYLTSIETPKRIQILFQGLIFTCNSLILLIAHLYTGVFSYNTGTLSAFMIIPAIIGMQFGVGIQGYLNQEKFRMLTLISLCLGGFYLMFRSLYMF